MNVADMTKEQARATGDAKLWHEWNKKQGGRVNGHCPVLGGHIGAGTGESCCICMGRISR